MEQKLWWHKRNRIIQYNLQVRDAEKINAEELAEQTMAMGANAIVINAADTWVWYATKYPYLRRTSEKRDFVAEYVEAFHKRGIKLIMRFAAGITYEDDAYNQRPQWAARQPNGEPYIIGEKRPGPWRLNYRICTNSDFEKTISKGMFRELLTNYDIDATFIMGAPIAPCWCDRCKALYRKRYGKEMPDNAAEIDPTWKDVNMREFLLPYKKIQEEVAPGKPLITNYFPVDLNMGATMDLIIPASEIDERAEMAHWLCAESQDIISDGREKMVGKFITTLKMKAGCSCETTPAPLALLHTCPGMDWRHVGLTPEEYVSWCAQAGANGAQLWTSLTGIPNTIEDKRILDSVTRLHTLNRCADPDMEGAKSAARVLLINDGGRNFQGWGFGLIAGHIDFDVATMKQLNKERLGKYSLLIIPQGCSYEARHRTLLEDYMTAGGKVIIEGTDPVALEPVMPLLGIADSIVRSEPLRACYARIAPEHTVLQNLVGKTALLPFGGVVGYCDPAEGSKTLLTLVPPFTPARFSGSPPERASIPAPYTNIPLCIYHEVGDGAMMFVPGEMGWLYRRYALKDLSNMIISCAETMLAGEAMIRVKAPRDVLFTSFRKEDALLLHLVNFIGERPIQERIPCSNIVVKVPLSGEKKVTDVEAKMSGQEISWHVEDDVLTLTLPELDDWEMIRISLENEK